MAPRREETINSLNPCIICKSKSEMFYHNLRNEHYGRCTNKDCITRSCFPLEPKQAAKIWNARNGGVKNESDKETDTWKPWNPDEEDYESYCVRSMGR